MSIEAHIQAVTTKREQLKALIAGEMAHPHPDLGKITQYKKQNLALKEEMQRYLRERNKTSAATS
jgi:hypothetical protein